ncbi:hypothetical protein LCGC14_1282850 [marine sediment metagenome]|uniref:Uncharacterized protein n=1 Tax=marine sediment metagenome TaxID=412755 RepID=A0A0F9NBA1_9ZZZZ
MVEIIIGIILVVWGVLLADIETTKEIGGFILLIIGVLIIADMRK